MSPGKLSSVILEHHEFLIDDQTLSEIALLLRDAVPNTFVEVLVSLIKSDIHSLQVSFSYLNRAAGRYEDTRTGPNHVLRPVNVMRTSPNQVFRPIKTFYY